MLDLHNPIDQIILVTTLRIILGTVVFIIATVSLARFRKSLLTLMGFMLASNFVTLIVVLGMLTK